MLPQKEISDTLPLPDILVDTTVIPSIEDKEEARKQFNFKTKELGLKHYFSFDEMWEWLLEKRRMKIQKQHKQVLMDQERFRDGIMNLQEFIEDNVKKGIPGNYGEDPFPLEHIFVGGLYIRHLTVPSNMLTVTKIHKQDHVFFLQKGTISILTEEGVKNLTAPYMGITKVGTKRIIYHHDEVIFITVHATNETEVVKAEKQIFADDFEEIDEIKGIRKFIEI